MWSGTSQQKIDSLLSTQANRAEWDEFIMSYSFERSVSVPLRWIDFVVLML